MRAFATTATSEATTTTATTTADGPDCDCIVINDLKVCTADCTTVATAKTGWPTAQ
jgi:hypothetical protein